MGTISRLAMLLAVAVAVVVVSYVALRAIGSLMQGYSWQEMDWHQRGNTSIGDFFAASDIGKREVLREGRKCVEYFDYKDGVPVKTICPK
jgi:hypothetical protein